MVTPTRQATWVMQIFTAPTGTYRHLQA